MTLYNFKAACAWRKIIAIPQTTIPGKSNKKKNTDFDNSSHKASSDNTIVVITERYSELCSTRDGLPKQKIILRVFIMPALSDVIVFTDNFIFRTHKWQLRITYIQCVANYTWRFSQLNSTCISPEIQTNFVSQNNEKKCWSSLHSLSYGQQSE